MDGMYRELKHRLFLLDRIYDLYEAFIASYDLACQHYCAACCTCNMTLTTLEGYRLIADMDRTVRTALFIKMRELFDNRRFQPQMTINTIAQVCKEGKPVPDELIDPTWGTCPLLTDNACPVYALRPFGCRCMVSDRDCRETGYAHVDEFIVTINNMFLQYIEHIDPLGGTGSLIDMLGYFEKREHMETYQGEMTIARNAGLAANRPIPVLMVPPEHRRRVQPILQKLQQLDRN